MWAPTALLARRVSGGAHLRHISKTEISNAIIKPILHDKEAIWQNEKQKQKGKKKESGKV